MHFAAYMIVFFTYENKPVPKKGKKKNNTSILLSYIVAIELLIVSCLNQCVNRIMYIESYYQKKHIIPSLIIALYLIITQHIIVFLRAVIIIVANNSILRQDFLFLSHFKLPERSVLC